jgi:hypothetical protein
MDSDIPVLYGRVLPKNMAPRTPNEIAHYREMARNISNLMLKSKFLHRRPKIQTERIGRLSENTRRRRRPLQRVFLVEGSLSC